MLIIYCYNAKNLGKIAFQCHIWQKQQPILNVFASESGRSVQLEISSTHERHLKLI